MPANALKDPTKAVLTAFCAALAGLPLPVYTTLPLGVNEYVLLSQPTTVPGRGCTAAPAWDVTLLVSIYTRFEQKGNASLAPALDVGEQVLAATLGQPLALPDFTTSPVELVGTGIGQRSDGTGQYVTRTIRLRCTAYA